MKKPIILNNTTKELTAEECMGIIGGGEVSNYLRCVVTTLSSGGGGVRTLMLGVGVFGLARLIGVAVGCANS
jgi:hypothetical protein